MVGGWSIVGSASYNNVKGRSYLYNIVLGAWDYHQIIQASNWSDDDHFGRSVSINEKTFVVGSNNGDNGVVYLFKLQGETWTEDKY